MDPDPLEPANRGIFWLNVKLDDYVLAPVSRGWAYITPGVLRYRLDKVLRNLDFPRNFMNDLLQGDIKQGGVELSRFAINTTVGILGIFDPAAGLNLHSRPEDLGQTLGYWGVPPGPYLQLPLLGPSGLRDVATAPERLFSSVWVFVAPGVGFAISATDFINTRHLQDDTLRTLRDSSLDYYVSVRNAYRQRREAVVRNGEVEEDNPDDDVYDLYELDEDEVYSLQSDRP